MLKIGLAVLCFVTVAYSSIFDEGSRKQEERKYGPQFSLRCLIPNSQYKPDNVTTCICKSVGWADCQPDMLATTPTPSTTSSGPVDPSGPTDAPGPTDPSSSSSDPIDPTSSSGLTTTTWPTSSTTTGSTTTSKPAEPHPLDPLTSDEIDLTRKIILEAAATKSRATTYQETGSSNTSYIFNWITLHEPPKADLLPYFLSDTTPPPHIVERKSFVILIQKGTGNVTEAVVNLDTMVIESFTPVARGLQPSISPEEMLISETITRNDPEVQKRCAALGYSNMSLVSADPWSMGFVGDRPEFKNKRLIQLYLYGREYPKDNHYAHPFDFLVIVDMVQEKVIGIEELPTHDDFDAKNKDGNTVPKATDNYDYRLLPANFLRTDDRPIQIKSPKGPAYTVDGNEIRWQKYKLRIGFNGREGLVFYNVNYNDSGTVRPIMYRAAISEMWIPYGDPRPPYHRKAVFDMGEYGIGFNSNELKAQEDCVGDVKYFDGILNNSTGHPITYKNAICVHEEDAGILWKHVDYRTGDAVVVRSHRLVFTFIATVGNYEYIFNWRLYQDGSIQLEIQMSGILSINLLAVGVSSTPYGTVEFPQNNAQYHQHFFAVRMDTEIDGNLNSVYTSQAVPVEGETGSATNPYGQGFTSKKVDLKTASQGRTQVSAETSKIWIVSNPNNNNPYTNKPVGWKLMPMNTAPPLMRKDSPLRPKGGFLDYDVWVTPYQENELYAGGFYLNNSGLPEWVDRNPNASVDNADIVLWHNFGLTHIPRVEDYPVMPVETTGFWFKPYNFFLANPGLDVPPPNAGSTGERVEL